MKLSQLRAPIDKVVRYEILHPVTGKVWKDKNNKGVAFSVLGSDSIQFISAESEIFTKQLSELENIPQKDLKKFNRLDFFLSPEKINESNLIRLANCVVGWEGIEDEEGKPLPFSKDSFKKIMANPEFKWIRDQLQNFIQDRANFFDLG